MIEMIRNRGENKMINDNEARKSNILFRIKENLRIKITTTNTRQAVKSVKNRPGSPLNDNSFEIRLGAFDGSDPCMF